MSVLSRSMKTILVVFGIVLLFLFLPISVIGQETTDTSESGDTTATEETVTETRDVNWSESQSLKAENIANTIARELAKEAEEAIANLDKAVADLAAAEAALEGVKADPEATEEEIAAAEKAVADAKTAVESAEGAADNAAAEAMSVDVDTVKAMREEGLGWGEICHELGVHPSVLGNALGKEKKDQAQTEEGFIEKAWGKMKDTLNNTFEPDGESKNKDGGIASGNPGKDNKGKSNKGSGNKSGGNKSGGNKGGGNKGGGNKGGGNHGGGHGKK